MIAGARNTGLPLAPDPGNRTRREMMMKEMGKGKDIYQMQG